MNFKLVLVDTNPKMVAAWSKVFASHPGITVVHGSLTDQRTRAWVSPTNSRGQMSGGVDAAVKAALGRAIQPRVQRAISQMTGGTLPIGFATCVSTSRTAPDYLVSTPTMMGNGDDIRETLNVSLACAAAIQAVKMQNLALGGFINSVAMPGLGAGTGRLSVDVCADLMWSAIDLHEQHDFEDFTEMRMALEDTLGDLGPVTHHGHAHVESGYSHEPAANHRPGPVLIRPARPYEVRSA